MFDSSTGAQDAAVVTYTTLSYWASHRIVCLLHSYRKARVQAPAQRDKMTFCQVEELFGKLLLGGTTSAQQGEEKSAQELFGTLSGRSVPVVVHQNYWFKRTVIVLNNCTQFLVWKINNCLFSDSCSPFLFFFLLLMGREVRRREEGIIPLVKLASRFCPWRPTFQRTCQGESRSSKPPIKPLRIGWKMIKGRVWGCGSPHVLEGSSKDFRMPYVSRKITA